MKICPICKSEFGSGEIFCPNDGSRLSSRSQIGHVQVDPNDPLIGLVLGGRYRVIKAIGEGGMGIVYEGIHEVIEKKVAIKVLRDDFSKRSEVVERFRQEAKSASRIGHEHIVDISDFGETPTGQSFFVMEFLAGDDLANILGREGTIAPARAVNIIIQCCKALGAAHVKGIIHRDMKPENIFLTSRDDEPDFVKIVDFGIAKMSDIESDGTPGRKLTKTGMIFGTPEYMSPEQAAGKPLDHRVDVYALGVILFEMLTGRVPFVGDTFMGILTQHMFEDIPALEAVNPNVQCSEELAVVIFKTMSKDADERYPDMPALGRAVADAMDLEGAFSVDTMVGWGESPQATPVRLGEGARTIEMSAARSRKRLFALLGLGTLLLIGAVGGYFAFQPSSIAATGAGEPIPVGSEPPVQDHEGDSPGAAADASAVDAAPAELHALDAAGGEPSEPLPQMVSIEVITRPDGAEVLVGGDVACGPSPCSFEAEVGHSVRIQARKGNFIATRDLEPTQAMAIEMQLERRGRRHDRNGAMTSGMRTGMMTSSGHNDLKTPSIFQMR